MLQDIANSAFKPLLAVLFPVYELLHDGNSRYFWAYIVSGTALAFLVCHVARKDERGWSALWQRETWMSDSARNDYILVVLRPLLAFTLLSWAIVNGGAIANWVADVLRSAGVSGTVTDTTALLYAFALTVCLFVVDDFLKFIVHTAFHRFPALWEFHKVHHSAETLNFTTSERFHPFEAFLTSAVVAVGLGVVNGVFIALAGHKLTPITIASANIFLFTANIFGGVLRHSPCWLAFPPAIERWIISPAMHQIHHSSEQKHCDTNMGVTLSVWDRLFGTLMIAEGQTVKSYGIGEETPEWRSMTTILVRPFVASTAIVKSAIRRKLPKRPQAAKPAAAEN
jgi:sterol desaturase/sphingolipid hydroxylase (fatty acid hydroxylase superfamily)